MGSTWLTWIFAILSLAFVALAILGALWIGYLLVIAARSGIDRFGNWMERRRFLRSRR